MFSFSCPATILIIAYSFRSPDGQCMIIRLPNDRKIGAFRKKRVRRKRINWIKYLIWVPWFAVFLYLLLTAGGIQGIDFFFRTKHVMSVSDMQSFITYLIVIVLFFILVLTIGRRGACHTICWMSPFLVIGKKIKNMFSWPSLRLAANTEACLTCSSVCPMSIDVMPLVQTGVIDNDDCILCGSCADICPYGVIHFAVLKVIASRDYARSILDFKLH